MSALSTNDMSGPVVAVHSFAQNLGEKTFFYHQKSEKADHGYYPTQCIQVKIVTQQVVTTMSDGSLRQHAPTEVRTEVPVCSWTAGHGTNHCGVAGHP